MDYSEKWGTSIEEAVKLALDDLKLTEDQVEVIVLEQPSKGFFGIGSKLAKVRVEKKTLKQEQPENNSDKKSEITTDKYSKIKDNSFNSFSEKGNKKEDKKAENNKASDKESKQNFGKSDAQKSQITESVNKSVNKNASSEKRVKKDFRIDDLKISKENMEPLTEHAAIDFINDLTDKMNLNIDLTALKGDKIIYIEMNGKDAGTVIGKRGQTLDAIQYLTSLVVNKNRQEYTRVVIDAENYRSKREKTLEQLAHRLANKVIKTKRSVRLEPMNPYERKVIHATLQNNKYIYTRSEGDEPYRRVIVELKK